MSEEHGARRAFLDVEFDMLTLDDVLAWVARRDADMPFAYVVTPNVDHVVRRPKLQTVLRRAYDLADLCLCDSRILARLARACGIELSVVPGSDLTASLLDRGLDAGDRVLLIGGHIDDLRPLRTRYPALAFEQHIPPMGLLRDAAARTAAVEVAAASAARIVLLAVGSPQQELLALDMRESGRVSGTALCIGASVNFLVGRERRAPRIVQRLSLEWAWRLGRNPKRLARRYLVDDPAIFLMTWRWARKRRRPN